MIKNPINPMFAGQADKYDQFRARVKIWLPSLVTLDGIDFFKDQAMIQSMTQQVEQEKQQLLGRGQPLAAIPEEAKGQTTGQGQQQDDSAYQARGGAQRSYQFNQRAYKKYHSTKSLVERILKSHSEGNRFIRNEDL